MAMTPEEYKAMSIKEFTEAAKVYDSGHSGIYEMCKDDYPPILEELEKESFTDVLDCGCGTGPMIELLHKKYPEKQLCQHNDRNDFDACKILLRHKKTYQIQIKHHPQEYEESENNKILHRI